MSATIPLETGEGSPRALCTSLSGEKNPDVYPMHNAGTDHLAVGTTVHSAVLLHTQKPI